MRARRAPVKLPATVALAERDPNQQAEEDGSPMVFAASYPFLEVVWTMVLFFLLVAWLCLLVYVLGDIISRQDTSGWAKVLWIILVLVLPYLGVFIYLIAEQRGMGERASARQARPGGPQQNAKARQLLAEGSITQAEYDVLAPNAPAAT